MHPRQGLPDYVGVGRGVAFGQTGLAVVEAWGSCLVQVLCWAFFCPSTVARCSLVGLGAGV